MSQYCLEYNVQFSAPSNLQELKTIIKHHEKDVLLVDELSMYDFLAVNKHLKQQSNKDEMKCR